MLLPINQPLRLDDTLCCGQGHRWLKEAGDRAWWNTVMGSHLVRVRQPDGNDGPLEFETTGDSDTAAAFLSRQFRLDDPVEGIYRKLSERDPVLAQLVEKYWGLRVMQVDPWECLVFFILSAMGPISRTRDNCERLAAEFGYGVGPKEFQRYTFPKASDLVIAGESRLAQLLVGLPSYPSRLSQTSKSVDSGELDLNALQYMEYRDAFRLLTAKRGRGIGPKVANCVALFSLEKLEAFPIDGNIHQALKRLYGHEPDFSLQWRPESRDLRMWVANRFGRYAGYASQFLFLDHRRQKRQAG